MNTSQVLQLADDLEYNLDELEDALQPLLAQALTETTKKLPLLDRAKLNVTTVYALGSLIFSYLKLHDVDAKNHKVFTELLRVKQYLEKIRIAEEGVINSQAPTPTSSGPNLRLDKPAAARIFKHDLADTDREELARAEAEARQKFLANRKLKALEASMKAKAATKDTTMTDVNIQGTMDVQAESASAGDNQSDESASEQLLASLMEAAEARAVTDFNTTTVASESTSKKSKKEKKRKRPEPEPEPEPDDLEDGEVAEPKKKSKKQRKREAKDAARALATTNPSG